MTSTEDISALLDNDLRDAERRQPFVSFDDPLKARRNFRRAVALSRALRGPAPEQDDVAIRNTVVAPADDSDREIPVRIYEPKNRKNSAPLPVLVYLHGGAFVAGDLETEHDRCVRYVREADCALVSVEYRRPPEHPFPAPAEDGYAVVSEVVRTADTRGWDGTRVAVGGSSAGGNLAAAVALMARDRGGPALVLQLLLYPALDDRLETGSVRRFRRASGWDVEDSPHMWRHYLGGEPGGGPPPHAVPARCDDFHGVAPAYLLVAEVDALRDEGIDYACRLMRDGVHVELHCYAGAFHGFELAAPNAAASRRAHADQAAALRAAFTVRAG
ncbi:alpha/beta hydrolase [Streptomyces sp. JJ38]|nr:alpha/beta hydrolase [Streptomyces sp. JJ38]